MSIRITIAWWSFYFAFMFLPFIVVFLARIPFDKSVSAIYLSGFITASGVFLSILTAALINKNDVLETSLTLAISLDLLYFAGAIFIVFQSALVGEPKISDLTVIMSSLMVDIATAITVINKLRSENV